MSNLTGSEKRTITAAVESLGIDQTNTVYCPCCVTDWKEQGKPSMWKPSRSMSVTKDRIMLKYHCFRATCSRGSGILIHNSIELPRTTKKFIPTKYEYRLRNLSKKELSYLQENYFISAEQVSQHGIMFNKDKQMYVFPIKDIRGYTIGYVDRDYTGTKKLKAISSWFNESPKLHFVVSHESTIGGVLIVEDIPSAIRAGKHMTTAALMGSNISADQAQHLAALFRNVVLALDEDAFAKAVLLRSKYSYYFDSFTLLRLTKDIKNMNPQELEELFRKVRC